MKKDRKGRLEIRRLPEQRDPPSVPEEPWSVKEDIKVPLENVAGCLMCPLYSSTCFYSNPHFNMCKQ